MNTITKDRLQEIAEEVNAEHAKIEGTLREGLARAVKVGNLLLEAKSTVKHGAWGKWLADNCAFSERTAQNYMRLAKRYPELVKSATVADLTYREAVGLLAEPPRPPSPPEVLEAVQEAHTEFMLWRERVMGELENPNTDIRRFTEIQKEADAYYRGWAEIKVRAERRAGQMLQVLNERQRNALAEPLAEV